ncbi:MAG: hypothetical protein ACRDN9_06450 [Streptosporangiaceae bacterium]
MRHYVPWYGLNGRPITDLEAEVLLSDLDSRTVANTAIPARDGNVIVVSTMFSVTPSGANGGRSPALWETIVVGDSGSDRVDHHTSRKDAERYHEAIVADIRSRHGSNDETVASRQRQTERAQSGTPAEGAQSGTPAYAAQR